MRLGQVGDGGIVRHSMSGDLLILSLVWSSIQDGAEYKHKDTDYADQAQQQHGKSEFARFHLRSVYQGNSSERKKCGLDQFP